MINIKKQNGSALVIALLIMGILMTLALGLSDLIIRELRVTNDIINGGKAYYAAEAGIESGLLDLHQNASGFEAENIGEDNKNFDISESDEAQLSFIYSIDSKTDTIPYIDTQVYDPNVVNTDPSITYGSLELNETVSIPLYTIDENGQRKDVTEFIVQYYLDAEIHPYWFGKIRFIDLDLLRWKITGLKEDIYDSLITESIGDYIGVVDESDEYRPTCIGTSTALSFITGPFDGIDYRVDECNSGIYSISRESYTFDYIDGEYTTLKNLESENNPKTIKIFLEEHTHNYLTLVNAFDPQFLQGGTNKATIKYRIIIPKDDESTIREFAKITSTGFTGKLRKRLEVLIRPDRFMPVFNFSLFRTQVGNEADDKDSPEGPNIN